ARPFTKVIRPQGGPTGPEPRAPILRMTEKSARFLDLVCNLFRPRSLRGVYEELAEAEDVHPDDHVVLHRPSARDCHGDVELLAGDHEVRIAERGGSGGPS